MKKILRRIFDYFTANTCRKVFFFGMLVSLVIAVINFIARSNVLTYLLFIAITVTMTASLVDSMMARRRFLLKIKDLQYEHLHAIYEKQQNGEDVVVTPTFTPQEKKYLRGKRWEFIGVIMMKLSVVLILFFLLLG